MKLLTFLYRAVATTLLAGMCCQPLLAQPFTYQGMLREKGVPADGNYDFRFRLYRDPDGSNQVGSAVFRTNVPVQNGVFTVQVDFGDVWTGEARYMEVSVRRARVGSYTLLSPMVLHLTLFSLDVRRMLNTFPGLESQACQRALRTMWTNDTIYTAGAGLQLSGNTFSIANGGVVSAMLADGAVVTGKIGDGAVTTAKIGDAQVTDAKIVSVSWSKVTGAPSSFPPSGSAGGDLSGSYPNPTVAKLQGRAVSSTAPSTGQVLKWDGSQWSPSVDLRDAFWQASGSNICYNVGNVGIGTASSLHRLHVEASTGDCAMYGYATIGVTYGVYGRSASTNGTGVYGHADATSGDTCGVYGQSDSTSGTGVFGVAQASRGYNYGVVGMSFSISGTGVYGTAAYRGVWGCASGTSGINYGVYGQSDSPQGYGVFSAGSFAATGTKSFQIDHPLNPENAVLNHYSAEGPEPYNIYRGTVVLDARGEAWVQLPDYFESINRDPSYHLTPVGAPMPNLHVAVEIQGNRFRIAGGVPGKKVCWEVKAIRHDRWVQEYGYQTEQPKPPEQRGKYLHPELYGQPKELGIHHAPERAVEGVPLAPATR